MKKILSLGLALALALTVLAGCANKGGQTADVNLEEFYQTIFTDPADAPAMMAMEGEMLDAYFRTLDRKRLCVTRLQIINSPTSPFFFIVEKK